MHDLLLTLQRLWDVAWPAIAAAGGVSIALQLIKHWAELQSEKVINFFLAVLSFLTVGANYLMSTTNLPPSIVGLKTAALVGIANILYHMPVIGIKSLSGVLRDAKKLRESTKTTTIAATTTISPTESTTSIEKTVTAPAITPAQSAAALNEFDNA